MTFSNTNLEKLIQMATIEHMYAMLQKMKNDNVINKPQECNFTEETFSTSNNDTNVSLLNEVKFLKIELDKQYDKIRKNDAEILNIIF